MKRILFFLICTMCFAQIAMAQPATYSVPVSIGRKNCGGGTTTNDSVFFFRYVGAALSRATYPNAYKPRLKIGPASTTDRWTISAASISFNPKDQKLYYLWTNYSASPVRTYIWRWKPDTTFATAASPGTANFLDTLRSFPYDIGGVAFDNNGIGWTLEFPAAPCARAFFRPIDFAANIYNSADTLDFTTGPGGIGDTLFNPGSGDITMLPSGQIYYNFDNKLYTPDYGSYGGATHHIKATFIDTTRRPTGTTLVGLAYGDGDLISSYATGCIYRRLDPVTGDTNYVSYTYGSGLGVYSVDMTQFTSGVGASKKLVSVTPTGTPNQYNVVYNVFVKNYGTTPISNVQVTDDLASINGIGNVSNVTATLISNPAGVTLNPLYNGTIVTTLLAASQSLPNYPTTNNNFTIQISCRLSNIQSGTYYYNSAVATANGFNNVALRDSSTNGNSPDLNQNDKPDDAGEGQPTPLLIKITPIAQPCNVLNQVMYTETFGTGTGLTATLPTTPNTFSTTFFGTAAAPMPVNRYTLTNNAVNGDGSNWVSLTDHTGGVNGRMLLVNADAAANVFFRDTMPAVCAGQQYNILFWAAFVGNNTYKVTCDGLGGFRYPVILIRVKDQATSAIITEAYTDTIKLTSWNQYGIKWTAPTGFSNAIIELVNAGAGGCGNDLAIDDIQFGLCSPAPSISLGGITAGCLGGSQTLTSSISDTTAIPGSKDYQWQWSPAPGSGPWTNIGGATSSNYTINPVTATDTGRYYRVIVASTGNIGVSSCQYISPGVKLTGKAPSVAAASANKNKNNICPGVSVQLSLTGGTLGTAAAWKWYTGSPGGTLVGTGSTLNVTPAVTTTYYVRAEGDCNTTADVSVTVTISCNIDKDQDGIPDFVESNMAAAFADANSNTVINAYDPTYAGFVDYNNDFVNDNFQADGDSDNDGIPNYLDATFPGRVDTNSDGVDDRFDQDKDGIINMLDLDSDNDGIPDVVEAYGVDTNGNGKIDNFTDADGDGLSDNVDTRIVAADGAYNTGTGLGLINLDGDAVPNFLDTDSDNDGIPDIREVLAPDTNNDGKVDGFTDANSDGLHDSYINAGALLITGADGNADGRADSWPNKNLDRDLRPNAYDMDSDGDGIIDAIEAGGGITDTDLNGIADGAIGTNGWSTTVSALGSLTLRNTDGNGNPDFLDIDADNDGIPDNIEGMSTAGYQLPTTTDTDGDGLASPYDNLVGFGGSGIFVYDNDMDGTPDYRDLDTDGDGSSDLCEGNDWNGDGFCNEILILTGVDTDGDGLDNLFDSLNSVTNLKGTSYMMGNGGSLTGDPTPGTKATVQKKTVAQGDRDWRWTATVLPVQFLGFTGVLQNTQVSLNWSILATKEVNRFEIERSTDNSNYTKVGTVTDAVQLNVQQNYGYVDNIAGISSDVFYYRLKVIGKAGEVKYSNVLVVRQSQAKTPVSIMPNPASNYATIRFFTEKESQVTMRLVDNIGKTVLLQQIKAGKGNNSIQLTNLNRYSSGVYSVQLVVNGETVTQKLIISN
ncbi:MAG: T9SS type A sorting domain-containing protein [Ferruginibacter sp.]